MLLLRWLFCCLLVVAGSVGDAAELLPVPGLMPVREAETTQVQAQAQVQAKSQAWTRLSTESMLDLSTRAWVLEDPSGAMSLSDVLSSDVQARFVPPKSGRSPTHFGLTESAIWLRLQLMLDEPQPAQRLLQAGVPTLDDVALLELKPDGTQVRIQTGDTWPYAARPLPHRHFVFPLDFKPGEARTLYVRVVSGGTVSIPLTLWKPVSFWQHDQIFLALNALYFGLLGGLLLYNLFLYLSTREHRFLSYVLFSGSMAVGQLGLTGLGAQFFWTDAIWVSEHLPRASLAVTAWFAIRFVREVLDTRTSFKNLDRLLSILGMASLATLVSVFVLPQIVSARLINALSFSVGIYMVLVGIHTFQKRQPGAWYFLLAWSALLLGAVVLPLYNMGLLPANVWNRHALMLGSAVEMLMLSFALADSINTARREKAEAQARAIESEFARIDALQASEAELERRVRQRTLELEVANRKLHEKEVLLEHRANHDVLTGLANRMLLTTRADMGMRRSERTGKGFALAVLDLDGFKAINDKHGHAAGDELLVAVSQRMTALMRAVDTVARVGGDEFVLLLEGMDDPEHWKAFEAKLVQAIEQPVLLADGVMLRVGVSVGHAMYPAQAATFEQLMLRADQAMYTAKVWRKLNDGHGDWVLDAATMTAS